MPVQGYNGYGQLGDGTTVDKKAPTPESGNALWLDVQLGANFACGIQTSNRLYCWVRTGSGTGSCPLAARPLSPSPLPAMHMRRA